VKVSKLLSLAIVSAVLAGPATAQFTAVVAPPKPKVDPVAAAATPAAVAAAVQKDSIARITMTNMKDWVDSAAASLGTTVQPVTPDTAARQGTPPLAVPVRPVAPAAPTPERGTTEFREGAPAPNTATPLPLVALLGALVFASGLWLLRPRRAPQRSQGR
jgi:hypothetical protein